MPVTRFKVRNFKSFRNTDINLNTLNIIVGENAAGKSNMLQVFKFLNTFTYHGLNAAIEGQGGIDRIFNKDCNEDEQLEIYLEGYTENHNPSEKFNQKWMTASDSYRLLIYNKNGIVSASEELIINSEFLSDSNKKLKGKIHLRIEKDKPAINITDMPFPIDITDKLRNGILFGSAIPLMDFSPVINSIRGMKSYTFSSCTTMISSEEVENKSLLEDSSNIKSVLKGILSDSDKKRELLNYIGLLLPFAEDIEIAKDEEGIELVLTESFGQKDITRRITSPMLSDGTMDLISMLLSLFFDDAPLKLYEEPTRSIHPALSGKLIELLSDASKEGQILLTTHNPSMVAHTDPNDLLLVQRDRDGFSAIKRPADRAQIRVFLENQMGMEQLFVNRMLED